MEDGWRVGGWSVDGGFRVGKGWMEERQVMTEGGWVTNSR